MQLFVPLKSANRQRNSTSLMQSVFKFKTLQTVTAFASEYFYCFTVCYSTTGF